jgi:pyruvate formate lyase activating enzyme
MAEILGNIFEIQRFSIHDGPGIRTTVFLKGCPLRCLWCHNPEGITPSPLLSFIPDKCIACGFCVRVCPNSAHTMVEGRHLLDRAKCQTSGKCTAECYSGALEISGQWLTVAEVMAKVRRDLPFYETSGGGMTLSGGEPLMQFNFIEALLTAAKSEGLNCCIETSGFAPFEYYERLLTLVDLFLYDIKETDTARHIEYTGVSNEIILQNLRLLHASGACFLLRLPIIPGYNDRDDHFAKIVELARSMPGMVGVEIMPYHHLAQSKIDRFDLLHEGREQSSVPNAQMVRAWIDQFAKLGLDVINKIAPSLTPIETKLNNIPR